MSRFYKKFLIRHYLEFSYLINKKARDNKNKYNSSIFLSLPKRQQFFNFLNIKTKKFTGFSAGIFLLKMGRNQKFFKRNPKNIMTITLQLKKEYLFFFKKIYLFYIKNFNFRQYCLYQKILSLISPKIYYLIHHQSFMPKFLKKKRIKRRVLKMLQRQ